ncbi:hypothetical protein BaRGS_00029826 [Batillaria attramentaria]|uniref:Uncharacterized protein n=1 Tax=Batillaria attramentaria TaxID=370345 RepID=A0ABD0JW46_9CAEN
MTSRRLHHDRRPQPTDGRYGWLELQDTFGRHSVENISNCPDHLIVPTEDNKEEGPSVRSSGVYGLSDSAPLSHNCGLHHKKVDAYSDWSNHFYF